MAQNMADEGDFRYRGPITENTRFRALSLGWNPAVKKEAPASAT